MRSSTVAGIGFLLIGAAFLVIGIVVAAVHCSRRARRTAIARGLILTMNASYSDMHDDGPAAYTPTVQFVDLHGYQHVADVTLATQRYCESQTPVDLAYDPNSPTRNLIIVGDDRRIRRAAAIFVILACIFVAFAIFFFFGLNGVPQRV